MKFSLLIQFCIIYIFFIVGISIISEWLCKIKNNHENFSSFPLKKDLIYPAVTGYPSRLTTNLLQNENQIMREAYNVINNYKKLSNTYREIGSNLHKNFSVTYNNDTYYPKEQPVNMGFLKYHRL